MNHVDYVAMSASGTRTLTLTLFLVLVAATLAITIWASRQTRNATDFYAGGRSFTGFQNGMAIGGDYMSAASFLGIAGIIALNGYDGFLYSIGFLVAWLLALLLVAELMRNSGRFTMSDVLAFRMRQAPVRTAGSISTIVVSIFYLLAQMVGAGALVALLLGIKSGTDVPRHEHRRRQGRHDRPDRHPDDRVRGRRRHEGHHLRADRQGVPADDRRDPARLPGAHVLQVQPFLAARRRGDQVREGRGVPAAGPALRPGHRRQPDGHPGQQARPDLAGSRPRTRHGRPAAHPHPLLHGAQRPGRPARAWCGRSASSACSTC